MVKKKKIDIFHVGRPKTQSVMDIADAYAKREYAPFFKKKKAI